MELPSICARWRNRRVTLRPGQALTLQAMQEWLDGQRVSKLKWPERLEVVSAMPLTPTRKIIKARLLERVMQGSNGRCAN